MHFINYLYLWVENKQIESKYENTYFFPNNEIEFAEKV